MMVKVNKRKRLKIISKIKEKKKKPDRDHYYGSKGIHY